MSNRIYGIKVRFLVNSGRKISPYVWKSSLDHNSGEKIGGVNHVFRYIQGTRVVLEPGRVVPLPRDFRGWTILALGRLNRDFLEWRHITAPKLEFHVPANSPLGITHTRRARKSTVDKSIFPISHWGTREYS